MTLSARLVGEVQARSLASYLESPLAPFVPDDTEPLGHPFDQRAVSAVGQGPVQPLEATRHLVRCGLLSMSGGGSGDSLTSWGGAFTGNGPRRGLPCSATEGRSTKAGELPSSTSGSTPGYDSEVRSTYCLLSSWCDSIKCLIPRNSIWGVSVSLSSS